MTTPTSQQLDEIEARAAHFYEYGTMPSQDGQNALDQLTDTDVPVLIDAAASLCLPDCGECGHPRTVHSEGDDPVSPGECSQCPDGEQDHDYRPGPTTSAAPVLADRAGIRAAALTEAADAVARDREATIPLHTAWAKGMRRAEELLRRLAAEAHDGEPHVCKPGASTYYCPASGEMESDCHGGFDQCCDRPDLHQPAVPLAGSAAPAGDEDDVPPSRAHEVFYDGGEPKCVDNCPGCTAAEEARRG